MRRLAFTPENERFVRRELFEFWSVYYARRRWVTLHELRNCDLTPKEVRERQRSRFYKNPAPADLSGACKLATQVAFAMFNLDGQVVSNRVHTFVRMSDTSLYDINRNCADVVDLYTNGDAPHQVMLIYSRSARARAGRDSWRVTIDELAADLSQRAQAARCELHSGKPITRLPQWARITT